jgi:hypothetical protein
MVLVTFLAAPVFAQTGSGRKSEPGSFNEDASGVPLRLAGDCATEFKVL